MEGSGLTKRSYQDIMNEANRSRVEGAYRPSKPQRTGRWYAVRAGLLVGALTGCAMYLGALHEKGLKSAASDAVTAVEDTLFSGQHAVSSFMRNSLQVESKSIDNTLSDDDRKAIVDFVKQMESSGFSFDKIMPYLKPEAAQKLQALRRMYNQEVGKNGGNSYSNGR